MRRNTRFPKPLDSIPDTRHVQSMTPRERAESYARVFPQYPLLRYDDRWIDGFWVLGNNYKGSGLHGSYPPGYLKRIKALFPDKFKGRVLHLFSGELPDTVVGFRLDISKKRDPPPDVYGDAQRLPFADSSLDLIVADPPYTPADAKKYGTVMINRRAVLAECARVLKPGGILIWLDTRQPMHRKLEWHWFGVIGLARSGNHLYRAVTFYQRRGKITMASVKARIKSAAEKIVSAIAILIGEDEATVSEAFAAQIANTKTREGKDDDAEPAKRGRGRPKKAVADDDDDDEAPPKKKGPKPPAKDDDDDDEEAPAKKKKKMAAADDDDDDDDDDDEVAAIPSDAKLEAMERKALKVLAEAHGIEFQGLNREDLTKALQEKRDGGKAKTKKKAKPAEDEDDDEAPPKKKKKPAADDDDDDDEEEAPKKKKKKAAAEDEVDPPDEDDYPKVKVQKSDLEAFFKLNKQPLKDAGFFGGKAKKGVEKMQHTYDEVMGDVDLIKEAWADNVWPEIQGGTWDKMKASAEELDDEDDD